MHYLVNLNAQHLVVVISIRLLTHPTHMKQYPCLLPYTFSVLPSVRSVVMTAMSHRGHVTLSLGSDQVLCCQLQLSADDSFANLTVYMCCFLLRWTLLLHQYQLWASGCTWDVQHRTGAGSPKHQCHMTLNISCLTDVLLQQYKHGVYLVKRDVLARVW